MVPLPGLDDPHSARFAWARFRRILWVMAAVSLLVALAVAGLLWALRGPLPWIFVGMAIGGVWATMMMAALLMGLMFLSSGTGHDHQVDDRVGEDARAAAGDETEVHERS
jgi:hypothetical protein